MVSVSIVELKIEKLNSKIIETNFEIRIIGILNICLIIFYDTSVEVSQRYMLVWKDRKIGICKSKMI